MNKYIKYAFALALPTVALSSCDDYLDTMPDNRATLDKEEKIKSLLVSAYPTAEFALVNELSSDNVDDYSNQYNKTSRWIEDAFAWKDEMEDPNESLTEYWDKAFLSIAAANEALQAVDKLGGPEASANLSALRGEALLCRAYNYFNLANLFCENWTSDAAQMLGLPYITVPETQLRPNYERGNLADLYELIQKDIEEGLALVSDHYYDIPKYHFNQKAAYAFAARFYLFTEQWQNAVNAANKVLGSDPRALLRDWATFSKLPIDNSDVRENTYISANLNCNLLLQTANSVIGVVFGPYSSYNSYSHGSELAGYEDIQSTQAWGSSLMEGLAVTYTGNLDKVVLRNTPYLFEYTDPVQGIGYSHSVFAVFTADETLLVRAEANIMLHNYDEAASDLTAWAKNISGINRNLTPTSITDFYKDLEYCYDDEKHMASAPKKHLNPAFAIDGEGSTQESMLQCVLSFRRIETLHHGLRWFDVKRYGIEIPRRVMGLNGRPDHISDFLSKDDLRRVYQIPLNVRDAGFEPNPR